jgi:hypothetical protein
MKTLPDRDEALALAGVWLMWLALTFAAVAFSHAFREIGTTLPMTVRVGVELCYVNRWAIPSLIGTAAVVAIARAMRDSGKKQTACHAVTLCAFGYAVVVLGLLFVGMTR